MDIFIKIIQLILSLSIIIIIHEIGHFIPAKIFKTRVEKFFIFFDPWFAIFKTKIGDTLYGIGWLPLGGYVKISGIINENKDKNFKPKDWDFHSKSIFQRLIIMSGGVLLNTLLSIIIFSFLTFTNGEKFISAKSIKYGLYVSNIGEKIGFKNGDLIKSIDGKKIKTLNFLEQNIMLGSNIQLIRNGKLFNLFLSDKNKSIIFGSKNKINLFTGIRNPIVIKNIKNNFILKNNDKILSINSNPITSIKDVNKFIDKYKKSFLKVYFNRKNKNYEKLVKTNDLSGVKLSIYNKNTFSIIYKNYNFLQSIIRGYNRSFAYLKIQLNFLKKIFNIDNKLYKQVGSIFSMTKIFPKVWNTEIFLEITASISIWLAFLNILPIPSLDGGYILFIIIEFIIGRKINESFLRISTIISFIIISIFTIIILGWDTINNFF